MPLFALSFSNRQGKSYFQSILGTSYFNHATKFQGGGEYEYGNDYFVPKITIKTVQWRLTRAFLQKQRLDIVIYKFGLNDLFVYKLNYYKID